MSPDELRGHIETIERSYEFFLAYAAQGASQEEATRVGAQLREYLGQVEAATAALAEGLPGLAGGESHAEFFEVAAADAARALAAVRLVRAQPSIGSRLVDNLNASIHVRTLLTDLFLIDDAL